jgi:DNA polymerase III sliding clamp (beta) subunit (PCNA family)
LSLAATDMERTVIASAEAVVCHPAPEENGYFQVFLPARRVLNILHEAPQGDITVWVKKDHATVSADGTSWRLSLPVDEGYPVLTDTGAMTFTPYSREQLLEALKAVRHAVCKDAGRPNLTQVAITAETEDENPIRVVTASDGSRMARVRLDGFPAPLCIPSTVLDDLLRLLAASPVENIGVGQTEGAQGAVVFTAGHVILAARKRMAAFPDIDRLLLAPALGNKDQLNVDKDQLLTAIRRVRINADSETSAIALRLYPAEPGGSSRVTVVSRDKGGNSAEEVITAAWAGGERLLVVNHQFLTEMVQAHPSPSCVFRLGKDSGKKRSMVMLNGEGSVQIIAQMPPGLVGY